MTDPLAPLLRKADVLGFWLAAGFFVAAILAIAAVALWG